MFIPDKARSGDNPGSYSATQALALNNNQRRLRTPTDGNHALQYGSAYDGPLLYGYGGGALGYTTDGTTITPALRWTRSNNVSVGVAGTSPDLAFGGSGTGAGIGSARSSGNPNQYGIDFYTGFNKRLSISNTGSVGVGTTAPSSTAPWRGPERARQQLGYPVQQLRGQLPDAGPHARNRLLPAARRRHLPGPHLLRE